MKNRIKKLFLLGLGLSVLLVFPGQAWARNNYKKSKTFKQPTITSNGNFFKGKTRTRNLITGKIKAITPKTNFRAKKFKAANFKTPKNNQNFESKKFKNQSFKNPVVNKRTSTKGGFLKNLFKQRKNKNPEKVTIGKTTWETKKNNNGTRTFTKTRNGKFLKTNKTTTFGKDNGFSKSKEIGFVVPFNEKRQRGNQFTKKKTLTIKKGEGLKRTKNVFSQGTKRGKDISKGYNSNLSINKKNGISFNVSPRKPDSGYFRK